MRRLICSEEFLYVCKKKLEFNVTKLDFAPSI